MVLTYKVRIEQIHKYKEEQVLVLVFVIVTATERCRVLALVSRASWRFHGKFRVSYNHLQIFVSHSNKGCRDQAFRFRSSLVFATVELQRVFSLHVPLRTRFPHPLLACVAEPELGQCRVVYSCRVRGRSEGETVQNSYSGLTGFSQGPKKHISIISILQAGIFLPYWALL